MKLPAVFREVCWGRALFQKGFPQQASPNIAGNLKDIYMYCRQYLCTQSNAASSQSACHIAVISLFCRLRIPIFYCIDNAGNSGDHRKQNRSAHCLVQDSPKEKTDDSGKAHHDNGYYGSKLFHVAFLLNRLPQCCYSFQFLCCSTSALEMVSV